MLKTAHDIYKDGGLVFANEHMVPKNGAEIIVTFFDEEKENIPTEPDPIEALRGRGKGERLVEKLLQSRREDLERDERSYRRLRS